MPQGRNPLMWGIAALSYVCVAAAAIPSML
jgi:hypothetical protein